jgi:hypothetical protein
LDFNQYRFNKVLGFRLNEGEAVQVTNPFLAHGNAEVLRNDLCAANASSQLTCPHLTEINGRRRNSPHTFSSFTRHTDFAISSKILNSTSK